MVHISRRDVATTVAGKLAPSKFPPAESPSRRTLENEVYPCLLNTTGI